METHEVITQNIAAILPKKTMLGNGLKNYGNDGNNILFKQNVCIR